MTTLPSPAELRGQFVLAADGNAVPDGFERRALGGWTLGTSDLPVVDLRDRTGAHVGWCLGHPVADGVLLGDGDTLLVGDPAAAVDELLEVLAGRFLLVLLGGGAPLVAPDAYGSLAAVWSAEQRVVASTPTLVAAEPDVALAEATGFPYRSTWLPFGRTLARGVRRLVADHVLDLRTWRVQRSWAPSPEAGGTGEELAVLVRESVQRTIEAVAAVAPLTLSLTAGRDSRLLLACARGVLDRTTTFTLVSPGPRTVDPHLASRLAARHGLRHEQLPVSRATDGPALERWLAVTGHAVGGELWHAHGALARLDPRRALLPGTAGEVGRAHTWRPGDPEDGPVAPDTLLERLRLPRLDVHLAAAEEWLAGLPELPYATVLELGYVEQRLSCWAGPGHYGNRTSLFELSPFASRPLFRAMLAAPREYRSGEHLTDDVCRAAWPELLDLPFNRFTGVRGATRRGLGAARRVARRAVGARGPAAGPVHAASQAAPVSPHSRG